MKTKRYLLHLLNQRCVAWARPTGCQPVSGAVTSKPELCCLFSGTVRLASPLGSLFEVNGPGEAISPHGEPKQRGGDGRPFDRLRVPNKVEGDTCPTTAATHNRLGLQRPCSVTAPVGRAPRGFSLVEVTLAIAVVAIGLVGIMALFPLGLDAVRQAADSTQMMAIGQDVLADFQQEAANSNCYALGSSGYSTNVIDPASLSYGNFASNSNVDGIWYRVEAWVTNAGFSNISVGGTNMISRVCILVFRTNGSSSTTPLSSTNYYFTEVDRYVQ